MKKSHEDKVMREGVEQNKLARHPSVLSTVIQRIAKSEMLVQPEEGGPENAPNTEEKITYNNVVRYRYTIESYSGYQAKLNRLYEEFEAQGSQMRAHIFRYVKTLYMQEKGKYPTVENLREHADDIIEAVQGRMQTMVEKSDGDESLPRPEEELLEMGVLVVLVDAFMCCRILEEPSKV
jgi:hypothetical protein